MGRTRTRRLRLVAAIAAGAIGCTRSVTSSASSGDTQTSSSSGSSTGGATGSSSGGTTQSSASGTGSTSATGGGASATGTTGTTTGATIASPFVDGGYVFCSLPNAADAGPNGDGGLAQWMCQPGTYFCDLSGNIGNCFQCRSDADCADQVLSTYDPSRQRCDLDSGIPGYQNFCVQCLQSPDCVGNPAGSLCDFNPTYPPFEFQPSIVDLGFETCGKIQTDCRLLGGPVCVTSNQVCDPFDGQCEARSTSCTTDQDCAGLRLPDPGFQAGSPYLELPYCVNGTCNACEGGVCPNDKACVSDADCGNPTSSPTGLHCELFVDGGSECACTDSSQCGGFWPACVGLDGGNGNDAGQPIGVCSCDSDEQCGDGGLVCIPPQVVIRRLIFSETVVNIYGPQTGSSFCGVPCTSPDFGSCSIFAGPASPICYIQNGVCTQCLLDEECTSSIGSGGPFCAYDVGAGRGCVCILDSDCPAGFACNALPGNCVPIPDFSRCTPDSCAGFFCNWDSGMCNDLDGIYTPNCLSDFDCPGGVCVNGSCVACRDNADCIVSGNTSASFCCLYGPSCDAIGALIGTCVDFCVTDHDCLGNTHGPSCSVDAGTHEECGCGSNADCSAGLRCAPAGEGDAGFCVDGCTVDGGCPSGFACNPVDVCQPECSFSGDCDGGLGCVSVVDCPDGQGCNPQSHTCGTCLGPNANGGPFDCPPDAICSNYWGGASGVCLQNCDREACPASRPICAVFPALTPEHKYCFGCLEDSDCVDGGVCDESFNRTFSCPPGG